MGIARRVQSDRAVQPATFHDGGLPRTDPPPVGELTAVVVTQPRAAGHVVRQSRVVSLPQVLEGPNAEPDGQDPLLARVHGARRIVRPDSISINAVCEAALVHVPVRPAPNHRLVDPAPLERRRAWRGQGHVDERVVPLDQVRAVRIRRGDERHENGNDPDFPRNIREQPCPGPLGPDREAVHDEVDITHFKPDQIRVPEPIVLEATNAASPVEQRVELNHVVESVREKPGNPREIGIVCGGEVERPRPSVGEA